MGNFPAFPRGVSGLACYNIDKGVNMTIMSEEKPNFVRCKRCDELKARATEFRTDRIDYNCLSCLSIIRQEAARTKRGVLLTIHASQRQHSRSRGHEQPTYTQLELINQYIEDPVFLYLYNTWVASGYDRQMKPSLDREDDSKGYSFDNVVMKTYGENRSKYSRQKVKGEATHNDCKAVIAYSLEGEPVKTYHSIAQAVRELKATSNAISRACTGRLNKHCGFMWRYVDEVSSNTKWLKPYRRGMVWDT